MTDVYPPHDPDDPMAALHAVEAVWLASDSTVRWCDHCIPERRMLPMAGTAWGVEVFHAPSCPENEDNHTPIRPLGEPSEDW